MFSFFLRLPDRWPHDLMIVVALGWTGLALVSSPLFDLTYTTNGFGAAVLIAYIVAFILGSWGVSAADRGSSSRQVQTRAPADYTPLFVAVCLLAILGVSLRLFDHLILRDADLAIAEIARRKIDVSATADQSPLGLIAAPMVAFCYFPMLLLALNSRRLPGPARLLAYVLVAFPALEAFFFQGGAMGAGYALIMLLCIHSVRRSQQSGGRPLRRSILTGRQQVFSGAAVAIIVVGAAALYQARIGELTGWSVSQYLLYLQISSQNILVPSTLLLTLSDIPIIGSIFAGIYWFCLYVTSGVHNLMFVIEVPAILHTSGGTQGQVFVRAFDILTNSSRPPIIDANPLAGFYQTMFGDVFLDFGVIGGLVQCLLMGIGAGLVHRARMRGYLVGQILDPILKTFVMMGVFISSLSAFGLFILMAGLGVLVLGIFLPRTTPAHISRRREQAQDRVRLGRTSTTV